MTSSEIATLSRPGHTFCVLPWVQLYASIDGLFARCGSDCSQFSEYYESPTKPVMQMHHDALGCLKGSPYAEDNPGSVETLRSAFNSARMRATREAMLAGKPVSACADCYDRERKTGQSMRTCYNAYYADKFDWPELLRRTTPDGAVDFHPVDLDLRLGNACNLHCQMCSFPVSSAWRRQTDSWHRSALIDPYAKDDQFWADLAELAPGLRTIFLAGGEPFIQPGHRKLLELLVERQVAKNIHLIYTSNLTLLPAWMFDAWKSFREVSVTASCDGTGAVFEKIRCGGKWDVFAANVVAVKRHVTRTKLATTVQRDNLPFLAELFAWAHAIQVPLDLANILTRPDSMSIVHTDPRELERCEQEYGALAKHYAELGNPDLATEIRGLCQALRSIRDASATRAAGSSV